MLQHVRLSRFFAVGVVFLAGGVGTSSGQVANADTSGLGPAWQNLGPGGGGWIQSICASPHDRDELFVGCDVGGFYHSLDGGRSYRISNAGLEDYGCDPSGAQICGFL